MSNQTNPTSPLQPRGTAQSVSIVLTFYNNVDYVDSALAQVSAIEGVEYELLVTDDGSTDGTREKLEQRAVLKPQIRLLASPRNLGIAAIRNWAVREASGRFIWFLDCDDRWEPDALATLLSLIETHSAQIGMVQAARVLKASQVEGKILEGAAPGRYEGAQLLELMLRGGIRGYLWNKLIERSLLLDHPFPDRRAQEDFAVIAEIVTAGSVVAVSDRVLYRHVERAGSLTNSRIEDFRDLQETFANVAMAVRDRDDATILTPALIFFEQWYLISSAVNTGVRLGLSPEAKRSLHHIRRRISWRRIMVVGRFSRREALIAALIKVLGPAYPLVYRLYLHREDAVAASRTGAT
jgi:glycosyltransferase involved in cell wall biosynthesis